MKTQTLKELIVSRPDLEITPFVSEDAASPDYNLTIARVSKCYIDKIALSPINDERMLVYGEDRDDFIDEFIDAINDEITDDEAESRAEAAYEAIEWTETIIIYIDSY